MQNRAPLSAGKGIVTGRFACAAISLGLCLSLAGCSLGPLAKHTAAFASATNQLVDSSSNAYRAAETLHEDAQGYQAVAKFDKTPPYDPYKATPLISDSGLEARLAVLDAIKTYADTLADLTNNVNSDKLDTAAASVGKNLQDLSGTLTSAISGSSTNPVTTMDANLVSTAADALGRYLVSKKTKAEVSKQIKIMAPSIDTLSKLLESDIGSLKSQSTLDYKIMIRDQDGFIRNHAALSPIERRDEILVIPRLVRRQRAADTLLVELQSSIHDFNLTYAALAAEANNNNPVSLRARIADLAASGQNLAKFYESLPTQ